MRHVLRSYLTAGVAITGVTKTSRKRCSLGAVLLAIAGAALLALTPAMTPMPTWRHNTVAADPALLASGDLPPVDVPPEPGQGVALLMGGSGFPIPPVDLTQTAFDEYLVPNGFGDYAIERLFTPEGLQPIDSGIKSLPFDTSVAQGVTIVEDAITKNIEAGHPVVVGGISQSATINSIVMADIVDGKLGFQPTPEQLAFFMAGNPSEPNGGLLERFDLPTQDSHPVIPSLGITFTGATPADTGFPTDIYTLEYDGFADFPRYPLNVLSDLNAVAGIAFVHPDYIAGRGPGPDPTPEQIADAIKLPTSDGYDGGTTYYMLPYEGQLPLAQLIQMIAGKPIADLLEPDLKVLVNLGYGPDPDVGWSESPANVPTPAGLFPSFDSEQFTTVLQALSDGAQQGFNDFMTDLSNPTNFASGATDPFDAADPPSFTDIVNAFSSATSQAYATLLPTADILNALTTTLPAEDLSLFTHYLQAGDLLDAIGMPAAVNTGLYTVAAGFEAFVLIETLQNIESTLAGLGDDLSP
jgi:hypothetical protein